jgi:hypothetical protein
MMREKGDLVPVIDKGRTESFNEYADFMKREKEQALGEMSDSSDEDQTTDIYG